MTLDELDEHLSDSRIGSVTLSVAANGHAYATVYFAQADGTFKADNQWSASNAEGLRMIFERANDTPVNEVPLAWLDDLL